MPDMVVTNLDRGKVELRNGVFQDELLVFGGEDTFVAGTILARRRVGLTPIAAADGGNTGTGTVTALAVTDGPVVPLVGAYVLRCTEAVSNGGVFRLEDPNGQVVASDIRMTAGSGASTVVEVAGLRFTLTDATDFIVGDLFTITVAADGKLVPFDPAGAGGAQFPIAVLTYDAYKADAGNLPVRPLVAGVVNKNRLVIDADGDGDNITAVIVDQLRAAGIVAEVVTQIATLDNQ